MDERIRRITNARGDAKSPGHPSTMTHCDCVGPELIAQTMESQVCPGICSWIAALGVICMNPVVGAVSSCIDQSKGRDDFPKLGILRLINVSRERGPLLCLTTSWAMTKKI
jgi:hypothetical protein